jgi:hypothetical protein
MAGGCRDCSRCTEVGAMSMVALLWRLPAALLFGWNVGLFQKKCPICNHRMALHIQRGAAVGDT